MVNKALRIVLSTIFTISLLFVVPFNNIYADTISSSNIVGVNVELLGSSILEHRLENGFNYYYKLYSYKAVIELDNSYVGVIGARVQGNYYEKLPNQNSSVTTQAFNYYRKIYVNGNSAEMTFVVSSWYSSYQDPINYRSDGTSPSVSIEDSNVVKYEDLDSIEQIIDILSDIYQNSEDIEGLSTDQLGELQSIVSNTSLANQYLKTISEWRFWPFPVESMRAMLLFTDPANFSTGAYKRYDYYSIGQYYWPIYGVFQQSKTVMQTAVVAPNASSAGNGHLGIFIFGCPCGTTANFEAMWEVYNADNYTVTRIQSFTLNNPENVTSILNWAFWRVEATCNTSKTVRIRTRTNEAFIIPIFVGSEVTNLGTEFALQWGLSNSFLDNINIIANGTTASSSAAQSSDSANSQLQQDSNTLFTQEDSFKQNMNSAMQNIDTTFTLNNFGQSFMTSAQWVRTQYETLTNNTPFASLITFSLLVGLALIVIGKVYK